MLEKKYSDFEKKVIETGSVEESINELKKSSNRKEDVENSLKDFISSDSGHQKRMVSDAFEQSKIKSFFIKFLVVSFSSGIAAAVLFFVGFR